MLEKLSHFLTLLNIYWISEFNTLDTGSKAKSEYWVWANIFMESV